jgi:hypothetical protein
MEFGGGHYSSHQSDRAKLRNFRKCKFIRVFYLFLVVAKGDAVKERRNQFIDEFIAVNGRSPFRREEHTPQS